MNGDMRNDAAIDPDLTVGFPISSILSYAYAVCENGETDGVRRVADKMLRALRAGVEEKLLEQGLEDSDVAKTITQAFGYIERRMTRFGLVWEERPEKVAEELSNGYAILKEDVSRFVSNPGGGQPSTASTDGSVATVPANALIEGDNLVTLTALRDSGAKFDLIYIDPPYNTLTGSFSYDDKRISPDDMFADSAWLSLMSKRIKLAREVLADTGFIVASIDDNEEAVLTLLMDKVFGKTNRIAKFVWHRRPRRPMSNMVSVDTEYLLLYAKNIETVTYLLEVQDEGRYTQRDEHYEMRGPYVELPLDMNLSYSRQLDYPITTPYGTAYPGGSRADWERRQNGGARARDHIWRWKKDKYEQNLKNGYISFRLGKDNVPRVYAKTYERVDNEGHPKDNTVPWSNLIEGIWTADGKKDYANVIGDNSFAFPKPIALIRHILKMTSSNARVLDFFAGSGTTGQAVLEANRDDGGTRTFVLATNDENGICSTVTYPRLKNVIEGYRKGGKPGGEEVPGIPATLCYLRAEAAPKTDDEFADMDMLTENAVIPCGFRVGDLSVPVRDGKMRTLWHIGDTADVCVDAEMTEDPGEVLDRSHAPNLFVPEWMADYMSQLSDKVGDRNIRYIPRAVFDTRHFR